MPLPISEQYRLLHKKRRRPKQLPHALQASDGDSPLHEPGAGEAAAGDAAGKVSRAEEAEVYALLDGEDVFKGKPKAKKKKKKKEKQEAAQQTPGMPHQAQQQGCSAKPSSQQQQRKKGAAHREQPNGGAASAHAHAADAEFIPFDFAAAQASAPGLDVLSRLRGRGGWQRGGGRGGRGGRARGRGDRGRGDRRGGGSEGGDQRSLGGALDRKGGGGSSGDAKRKGGGSMWDMPEDGEAIKGGKRSAVMPRSGNRNMTFG